MPPSVGVIRWDAWNGRSGDVISGNASRVLSPAKFHWRLPWYANVTGTNNVSIDGDQQWIVDLFALNRYPACALV